MFPIHDLTAFVAVADLGTVQAAADKVHRTQSAVSQALKRLEQAVGFSLMDRTEYRIQLTNEGRQFLQRARIVLRNAEGLQRFAGILASGVEERVRIAAHGALATSIWAPAVSAVARIYADTVIEVQTGEVDSPLAALRGGSADLALLILPPSAPQLNGFANQRLGRIAFVRVVRSDLVDAVATLPQIIVSDFCNSAASFGVEEGHRQCRVSSHAAKAELILQGAGWGSVPRHLVEAPLSAGTLVGLEMSNENTGAEHDYYLYGRRQPIAAGPVFSALWEAFSTAT
jgi:DNA-binding transcriptional LysR family regulator